MSTISSSRRIKILFEHTNLMDIINDLNHADRFFTNLRRGADGRQALGCPVRCLPGAHLPPTGERGELSSRFKKLWLLMVIFRLSWT